MSEDIWHLQCKLWCWLTLATERMKHERCRALLQMMRGVLFH